MFGRNQVMFKTKIFSQLLHSKQKFEKIKRNILKMKKIDFSDN